MHQPTVAGCWQQWLPFTYLHGGDDTCEFFDLSLEPWLIIRQLAPFQAQRIDLRRLQAMNWFATSQQTTASSDIDCNHGGTDAQTCVRQYLP